MGPLLQERTGVGWACGGVRIALVDQSSAHSPLLTLALENGAGILGVHSWNALPREVSSWPLRVEAFCPEAGGFPWDVLMIHRNALSFPNSSWVLVLRTTWKWFTQQCFVQCKKHVLYSFSAYCLPNPSFLVSENTLQNSAKHCH